MDRVFSVCVFYFVRMEISELIIERMSLLKSGSRNTITDKHEIG